MESGRKEELGAWERQVVCHRLVARIAAASHALCRRQSRLAFQVIKVPHTRRSQVDTLFPLMEATKAHVTFSKFTAPSHNDTETCHDVPAGRWILRWEVAFLGRNPVTTPGCFLSMKT